MKKYFEQLRPMERRLAVAVIVAVILVFNYIVIWPHFNDWGNLNSQISAGQQKLKMYQQAIAQTPAYEQKLKKFENQGEFVAPENQAINFMQTIQAESAATGVGILNTARSVTHTNDAFFVEQIQNISVLATDAQLVNFLYQLGNDPSMIRVRDLELAPDNPRQRLNASLQLVASYQKTPWKNFEKLNRLRQMKKYLSLLLLLVLTASVLRAQQTPPAFPPTLRRPPLRTPGMPPSPQNNAVQNNNAPQNNATQNAQNNPNNLAEDPSMQEKIPPGLIDFQGVDVSQVLEVYAQLVGRTLLRAGLPSAQIVLKTETPLTKAEAIQALQAVLALNGIAVVNVGDKFVKVVPVEQAGQTGQQFNNQDLNSLPDLGSYVTRIVHLQYVKPSLMVPIIQPFSKAPNAILPIDDNGILVLRDYSENIKRMMEMIAQVDIIVPAEYISRVIPIKYAMADDIASVLNSLEQTGGGTVSFGNTTTPGNSNPGNGIVHSGSSGSGVGGMNGIQGQGSQSSYGQSSSFGQQGTSGQAPGASPFANRLQSILNRVQGGANGGAQGGVTGPQQPIQILGQTKIIADERSNSLLIYATPQDMDTITNIVEKLDVLLAQVLIETVIMEVDLNKQWNYGISVAQNPASKGNVSTVGAINNGQPFYNFLNSVSSNTWPGNFVSTAPAGLSYFGSIGENWDLALQAAASDSSTHIIQRPRIQTSQAKEAQFFVGQSVPYVTSVYYDSGFNSGPSSSYSQLQVGISLDVTPFINPDGLVVMDINQQINDISGFTTITGVGNVPNTDNRTFTSEVAVKDRDTIILGGFTDTETAKSSTGVPILQDIPLLGNLFRSPSSNKTRDELLVLMRPTVLKTPELAAIQAVKEEVRLPGISAAEREERAVATQERKAEDAKEKSGGQFMVEPSVDATYTNSIQVNPNAR